jgi:sterol desaturase/sphingolipid hydroxylase (fatty acid hydroxylase superfamily)
MDNLFKKIFDWLSTLTYIEAILVFLFENIIIWMMAVLLGLALQKIFSHKKITENELGNVSTNWKLEIKLSLITILTNTGITIAGYYLWRGGIIHIKPFLGGFRDFLDVIFLVLIIDLSMYILHKLAHSRFFYFLLHTLHHKFREPTTITLFSLHPIETLSLGILWLGILCLYTSSIIGISVYLTLNIVFGVIGHCGVEPFPSYWTKIPLLKYITNAHFHLDHHRNEKVNYGFYTNIWDRIFNTMKK